MKVEIKLAAHLRRLIVLIAISMISLTYLTASGGSSLRVADAYVINHSSGVDSANLPPSVYRGIYTYAFETSSFRPCGSNERWWVSPSREVVRDLRARVPLESNNNRSRARRYSVYVEWRGEVSERGRYGHLGAYVRLLRPTEVLDARVERPADCHAASTSE